jgi:magnesium and cobalt exporter, CNNM family
LVTILFIVVLLLAVNALYVGAEFSLVGVRRHRVRRLADEGSLPARTLLPILSDPRRLNRAISTCQLGITASSLMLGAYARHTLAAALRPLLGTGAVSSATAETLTLVLTLALVTVFQVVLTEQVPKSVVLRDPLRWSMLLALPLRVSEMLAAGFLWLLQGSANLLVRVIGMRPWGTPSLHSAAEIGLIVAESARVGAVRPELREGVHSALRFSARSAQDVMVPRVRVRGLPLDAAREERRRIQRESPYTRMPVYRGSLDAIVGVLHVKDVLRCAARGEDPPLDELLRPVLTVPWSAPATELLDQMREARTTIAVVLDEHGGTAGIASLEDLAEEIVGDMEDEFDPRGEQPEQLADGRLRLRGEALLVDLRERYRVPLRSDEARTLGGLIMEALGRVAHPGDVVEVNGVRIEVEEMTRYRIESVLLTPPPPAAEEAS